MGHGQLLGSTETAKTLNQNNQDPIANILITSPQDRECVALPICSPSAGLGIHVYRGPLSVPHDYGYNPIGGISIRVLYQIWDD